MPVSQIIDYLRIYSAKIYSASGKEQSVLSAPAATRESRKGLALVLKNEEPPLKEALVKLKSK